MPGLCVQPSKAAWAPFALLRDREGGLGDRVAAQWSWVSLCHWGLWIGSLFLSSWSAVGSFVWLSELPGWDQNVLSGLCWVLLGPWALASLACYWLNTRVHFQLGLRCKLQSTRCVDVQALVALIGVGLSSLHVVSLFLLEKQSDSGFIVVCFALFEGKWSCRRGVLVRTMHTCSHGKKWE